MNATPRKDTVAGVILTGGRSTRMGQDKALVELSGQPLWRHVASVLRPLTADIIFAGAVEGLTAEHRVLRDDPEGLGPLGGIVTALESSGYEHHLVVAVDYPLVRSEVLRLLLERSPARQAVCARSAAFLEPLIGYYHADCAPVMRAMIASGETRTHRLYERVPSYVINDEEYDRVDPARWSQFNVNSPADLIRAEAMLQQGYPR